MEPIVKVYLPWVDEYERAVQLRDEECSTCAHIKDGGEGDYDVEKNHSTWHPIFRNYLVLRESIRAPRWGYPDGFVDHQRIQKDLEEPIRKYLQTVWITAKERLTNPSATLPPLPQSACNAKKTRVQQQPSKKSIMKKFLDVANEKRVLRTRNISQLPTQDPEVPIDSKSAAQAAALAVQQTSDSGSMGSTILKRWGEP